MVIVFRVIIFSYIDFFQKTYGLGILLIVGCVDVIYPVNMEQKIFFIKGQMRRLFFETFHDFECFGSVFLIKRCLWVSRRFWFIELFGLMVVIRSNSFFISVLSLDRFMVVCLL